MDVANGCEIHLDEDKPWILPHRGTAAKSFPRTALARRLHLNFPGPTWNHCGRGYAAGPANPNFRWGFGSSQHLPNTVLRPVAAANMNFPRGPHAARELQPHNSTDSVPVPFGSHQPNAQPRLRRFIMKEPRFRPVLSDNQVHSGIAIVVAQRAAALLPIHFDPGQLSGHGAKSPFAVAPQP